MIFGQYAQTAKDAQLGIEESKLKDSAWRHQQGISAMLKASPSKLAPSYQRRCNRFKAALRRNWSEFWRGRVNTEVARRQLNH
ncbi:hypothetical protein [Microcoleus sp. B3-C5]|uniref:hypothetical protein n=1 Tax=Microcoleus sp. B3-C5 TaxID=2818654 RepID=UPI002FD217F0